ncbi:hypothetical protein [Geothrix sp. 21YS21S-4]|uniref:hypothetical protein n=1 Tax=Geothrix sp. 21YS21S-4 TaxID=3068889 RepID=UPI0027BA65B7|nr:hypothetical protein [Geothrix sp. 21YS21S-4]
MKKIISAAIGGILSFMLFLSLAILIDFLFFDNINRAGPGFIQVATYAVLGGVITATSGAYRNPEPIFRVIYFFRKLFSLSQLTTGLKRTMFLVLIMGISLWGLNIGTYYINHWNDFYGFFELVPFNYGKDYTLYWFFFWLSMVLIVAGIAGSFLYDATIGHVIAWIRNGNKSDSNL